MTKKAGLYFLLTLVAAMLLMSACGSTTSGGTKGSNSAQSAEQVLQNTLAAMKQLKTAHFTVTSNSTAQTSPSAQSNTPPSIATTITGNGDEKMPDQVSLHLTTRLGTTGQSLTLSEILLQIKVYIQNPKGQWYVLDKSKLPGSFGASTSGNDASTVNNLLTLAQKATLTDHGTVSLNGQKLRRITVTFGKDALAQLLNQSSASKGSLPQQNTDQLLKSIKDFQANVDFWIDESTSYVHQMEEKLMMKIDGSKLGTTLTPTTTSTLSTNLTSNTDLTIDLSKFNQPVVITAPANAIPTDNPISIFQ